MRAEDLRLEELLTFADGLVSLHGRRLIMHSIHAMAQLRKDLVESLGSDQSRRILTRFGYFWGEADAAAMKRIFNWESIADWLKAAPRLLAMEGAAKTELSSLDLQPDNRLRMELVWHSAAEAEEQLMEFGISPEAGCFILQGYASGYASFCLKRPVYFVERSCRARGDDLCLALGMDRDSWGKECESFVSYFQADDIQGKIEELTAELRRKSEESMRQRRRLRKLQSVHRQGFSGIRSKVFQQVLDLGIRVARFDSSVLITGESGVGKELLAGLIHENSDRARGPFVAINCGALPENLLESELFGHKAGAFTGASRDRAGLFEESQGGTIFLDEIGEISMGLQVKLLRVLQEKRIRRIGENRTRAIDCRVIAATNRELEDDVRQGRFRQDLLYRIKVVEIKVPPLRDRPEDILPLARLFTQRLSKRFKIPGLTLDATCLECLMSYPWPGNVRELENALEHAAVVCEDGRIRPEDLPPDVRSSDLGSPVSIRFPRKTLAEVERQHIHAVLNETDGNRTRAARILGISPTTLWRKLKIKP